MKKILNYAIILFLGFLILLAGFITAHAVENTMPTRYDFIRFLKWGWIPLIILLLILRWMLARASRGNDKKDL
jgi:uncharacterized membrane protein YjgN (DUF898 family)